MSTNIQLELGVTIKKVNLDIRGKISNGKDFSVISLSGAIKPCKKETFEQKVEKLLADQGEIKDILTPFIPNKLDFGVYKISGKEKNNSLSAFQLGANYENFTLNGVLGNDVKLFSAVIDRPISLSYLPLVGEYLEGYAINSLDIIYDVYGKDNKVALIDKAKQPFVKDNWYYTDKKDGSKKSKLSKGFNASVDISMGAEPITIPYPLKDLGGFKMPELPKAVDNGKQKHPLVKVNEFKPSIADKKLSVAISADFNIGPFGIQVIGLSVALPFDAFKIFSKYSEYLTYYKEFERDKEKYKIFKEYLNGKPGLDTNKAVDKFKDSGDYTHLQELIKSERKSDFFKSIEFSLKGLALIYDTPAISIAGAFLREFYTHASVRESINVLVEQINTIVNVTNPEKPGVQVLVNEYNAVSTKMPSENDGIKQLTIISKANFDKEKYNVLQTLLLDLDNNIEKFNLLKDNPGKKIEEYNGLLTFRLAKKIEVIAIGSYIKTPTYSSLFAFGYLGIPIPVDPAFYIHGFALGFGLNRNFLMPNINEVSEFPLVKIVHQGGLKQGDNVQKIFSDLNKYLPASEGTYVIVAGIKFDSYKMIFTTGIVAIAFGNQNSFNLLGLSTMKLEGVYNFEFAFSMRADLDEGTFLAQGQLTNNTYILFPELKLTGGFALGMWLKGDNAGDFVFTLGGYHPNFNVPTHYPNNVNRLGYNFNLGPVNFYGEAYFALTPSCIMAGIAGGLRVVLDGSVVYAEVGIQFRADFLIAWKPFYYQADVSVQIYAKVVLDACIFSVSKTFQLTSNLSLKGPEFRGIVTFKVAKYELEVKFGNHDQSINNTLTKEEFIKAYLPDVTKILIYNISSGIIKKFKNKEGDEVIVVNPKTFALEINSEIPITELKYFTRENGKVKPLKTKIAQANKIAEDLETPSKDIKPVCNDADDLDNKLNLVISGATNNFSSFNGSLIKQSVPKAIWNTNNVLSEKDKLSSDNLLKNVCKGIRLEFKQENPKLNPVTVSLYDTLVKEYANEVSSVSLNPELDDAKTKKESIMSAFGILTDDVIDTTDLESTIDVYKYKSQSLGTYNVA